MELRNLATIHVGWRFDGVDPSDSMLDAARLATVEFGDRVVLGPGERIRDGAAVSVAKK